MNLESIAATLADRAAHAGLIVTEPLSAQLTVYYQVLVHWNRKINLTSLADPDEAVDRLLLEPVAAARALYLEVSEGAELGDLGSGGGSPAIPLALALSAKHLLMVESRSRKAAFLREAARELGLAATVETARFEEVAAFSQWRGHFDLISVRAVRIDYSALTALIGLLKPAGHAALFRTVDAPDPPPDLPEELVYRRTVGLLPASRSSLAILQRST